MDNFKSFAAILSDFSKISLFGRKMPILCAASPKNRPKMFHVKHPAEFFRFFRVSRETLNAKISAKCKILQRKEEKRRKIDRKYLSLSFWRQHPGSMRVTKLSFPSISPSGPNLRKFFSRSAVFVPLLCFFYPISEQIIGFIDLWNRKNRIFGVKKTLLRCLRAIFELDFPVFPGQKRSLFLIELLFFMIFLSLDS